MLYSVTMASLLALLLLFLLLSISICFVTGRRPGVRCCRRIVWDIRSVGQVGATVYHLCWFYLSGLMWAYQTWNLPQSDQVTHFSVFVCKFLINLFSDILVIFRISFFPWTVSCICPIVLRGLQDPFKNIMLAFYGEL